MKRLLLVAIGFTALVSAQSAPGHQGKQPIKKSTPAAKPTARPVFVGDSIVKVINSLVYAGGLNGKTEFETTATFELRMKASVSRFGQLAFVVDPYHEVDFEYDADKGEMCAKLSISSRSLYERPKGESSVRTIGLYSTSVSEGTYIGSNAFGAKAVVESSRDSEYGIFLDSASPLLHVVENKNKYQMAFPMSVDQARSTKPYLRGVVVGHLTEARVYTTREVTEPTITSPTKLIENGFYTSFYTEEYRIIDIRSGKIIATSIPRIVSPKSDELPPPAPLAESQAYPEPPDIRPKTTTTIPAPSLYPTPQPQESTPQHWDFPGWVYRIGGGVSAPVLIFKVDANYSKEAQKESLQGTVVLYVAVDELGQPRELKVVRPLGLGLNEEAMKAVRQWRFKPGMKDGRPVPVAATVEVSFRLPMDIGRSKLVKCIPLKKVEPTYPPLAKQARIQGEVRFNATIGKDGTIQDLRLVSGHPLLVPAAQEAVRQWLFSLSTERACVLFVKFVIGPR